MKPVYGVSEKKWKPLAPDGDVAKFFREGTRDLKPTPLPRIGKDLAKWIDGKRGCGGDGSGSGGAGADGDGDAVSAKRPPTC